MRCDDIAHLDNVIVIFSTPACIRVKSSYVDKHIAGSVEMQYSKLLKGQVVSDVVNVGKVPNLKLL